MMSQDDFLTQLRYQSLEAPSPVKPSPKRPVSKREPLESARGPRAELHLEPNVFSAEGCTAQPQQHQGSAIQEAAPGSAQFVTQMPLHAEERSSSSQSIPAETHKLNNPERSHQTSIGRECNSTLDKDTTERATRKATPKRQSSWQKKTAGARYLPRFIGFRARDQQDVVGNDASWQPSLAGRQLQGQVPLQLLQRLWQAADAAAEGGKQESDGEVSSSDEEVDLAHRSPRTTIAVESGPVGAVLQRSSSVSSSEMSWEDSPPRPAQGRPLLPPDSSPLQAREAAVANEDGGRPHTDADDTNGPSPQAVPIITSSPPAIPVATQATFLDLGSEADSDDQPDQINAPNELPDAEVRTAERSTLVVDTQIQKSSNDSAERGATSSLDSMQGVQVFRTPAIQRRQSGTDTVRADHRLHRAADRMYPSLSQIDQALVHPPSSQFVPAKCFLQDPRQMKSTIKSIAIEAAPACDRLPSVPTYGEGTSRPQVEHLRNKRRRESPMIEVSSQRQKVEGPSGKVVPTGKDPDLRAAEIIARQARDEFMAQERLRKEKLVRDREARERVENEKRDRDRRDVQEETAREVIVRDNEEREEVRRESERQEKEKEKTVAQSQPIQAASLVNDDLSAGSRDQALLPRSSILKHRASTPITGASDYQVSNVSKDHFEQRHSRGLSVIGAQDTFELFRVTYPDYRGGRTQFEQGCRLLLKLGNEAPRAYLNDDFVFRFNNDYMDDHYSREGKLSMEFEDYYRRLEDDPEFEPISVAKVLKPTRLANMLNDHSFRKDTVSMQGQPLSKAQPFNARVPSIPGSVEPRVPHLAARSEAATLVENGSPEHRSKLKSLNNSQDSSKSITDWLKTSEPPDQATNTHGQASPELGTPSNSDKLAHVRDPDLELELLAVLPAPGPKGTPRRLPWDSPEKSRPPPPSTAPARIAVIPVVGSAFARKPLPKEDKGKGKGKAVAAAPRRRQTDFPLPSRRQTEEARPIPWDKPIVFNKPPSNALMAVMDRYGKLEKQFSSMDERRGIPRPSINAGVDIFGWKGHGKGKGKERESLP